MWHISGQKAGPLGFVGGLLYCSKLRLSSRLNKANYFIIRSDLLATSKLLSAQKQRRRPQRENSREMMSLSYARISLPLKAGITVHSLHWQTVNLPTWTSLNQDMFPIHTHTHGCQSFFEIGKGFDSKTNPLFYSLMGLNVHLQPVSMTFITPS